MFMTLILISRQSLYAVQGLLNTIISFLSHEIPTLWTPLFNINSAILYIKLQSYRSKLCTDKDNLLSYNNDNISDSTQPFRNI